MGANVGETVKAVNHALKCAVALQKRCPAQANVNAMETVLQINLITCEWGNTGCGFMDSFGKGNTELTLITDSNGEASDVSLCRL
jgi:hypothetical protein